jgi:hypothetical protein
MMVAGAVLTSVGGTLVIASVGAVIGTAHNCVSFGGRTACDVNDAVVDPLLISGLVGLTGGVLLLMFGAPKVRVLSVSAAVHHLAIRDRS